MNPKTDIRWRGRAIDTLSREELIKALTQALLELHRTRGVPIIKATLHRGDPIYWDSTPKP